uniref:THAP domaincontaining protein 9like [Hydra vulgaris] n=1 Tax=Lepeophtheirus salmonis TaxID=72036 RepID=A0A0K2SZC8_LEPSM
MTMKVKLATQLISSSVADGIEFCNKDLQLLEFRNSEGTVEFLQTFDRIFDFTNSRSSLAKLFKSPLRTGKEDYWKPIVSRYVFIYF